MIHLGEETGTGSWGEELGINKGEEVNFNGVLRKGVGIVRGRAVSHTLCC